MSSRAPWIRWFSSDWIADTAHLGPLEEGVYSKLVQHYYQSRKPLPADIDRLSMIARATEPASRRAVEFIASEYFIPFEDPEFGLVLRHPRCDREIEWSDREHLAKSEGGRKGASRRWEQADDRSANRTPNGTPNGTPYGNQNQNQNQNKDKLQIQGETPSGSRRAAAPYREIQNLWNSTLPELPACQKLTETRKSSIRQRWEKDLPSLENWKNLFTYIRDSDFLMGRTTPPPGRRRFVATLDWLTKPENYAKVFEGRYHNG